MEINRFGAELSFFTKWVFKILKNFLKSFVAKKAFYG